MILSAVDLQTLSDIAISSAIDAAEMISANVGADIIVDKKKSGKSKAAQVVTEIDHKSQDLILNKLIPTCLEYDLGLLTEESEDDHSRFKKDYFWCIDPLDGTLPFVEARPGYAVSIALVSKAGRPVIGIVYDPVESVLYSAIKDMGAKKNGKRWRLETTTKKTAELIDRGGAVMNACWVLENASAYYKKNPKIYNGGGCLWDYAATAVIFNELGAWVSDASGKPLDLNRKDSVYMNHSGVIFASNKEIAKKIVNQ